MVQRIYGSQILSEDAINKHIEFNPSDERLGVKHLRPNTLTQVPSNIGPNNNQKKAKLSRY